MEVVVLEANHALKDQVFAVVAAMAKGAVTVEAAVMAEVAVMVEVALPEDIGVVEDEEASLCLAVHLAGIAEEPLERMAVAVVVVEPQVEIALTWVEEDLEEEHAQLYEAEQEETERKVEASYESCCLPTARYLKERSSKYFGRKSIVCSNHELQIPCKCIACTFHVLENKGNILKNFIV